MSSTREIDLRRPTCAIAQAQRHAAHGDGTFTGVAVEIDAAGAVGVPASGL